MMNMSASRRVGHSGSAVRQQARPRSAAQDVQNRGGADDGGPEIEDALLRLRLAGRYSVRIVDADCGDGARLVHAVLHARALGFVAIEGRGVDGAPSLVAKARRRGERVIDPAIGLTFEMADVAAVLAEEAELPADIVLWRDQPGALPGIGDALAAAGNVVIGHARRSVEAAA